MVMVLNAFVQLFLERLRTLTEEEIVRLLDVKENLVHLKENLVRIKAMLVNVESKNISQKSISIKLIKLQELMYNFDDLFDDYHLEAKNHHFSFTATAIERSRPSSSSPSSSRRYHVPSFMSYLFSIPFRHKIEKRILSINSALEKLHSKIPRLNLTGNLSNPDVMLHQASCSIQCDTSSMIIESKIVGIDKDAKCSIDMLIGNDMCKSKCPIYAITSMPRIRKTTLAKKVFNDL